MKLQKIISQRNYNSAAPFKIVYEWENIISDKGNINLSYLLRSYLYFL